MEITYGLISADSHVVLDKDAFARHMSPVKWGDRIPHVAEFEAATAGGSYWDTPGRADGDEHRLVHRWVVNGELAGRIANCPAVMDPTMKVMPERWEDVPAKAYDPAERLEALDTDQVDAEVLFFNDPGRGTFYQFGYDPEFELACVQAHNDALAEWQDVSERFVPLAVVPYLNGIEAAVAELERAAKAGHRGLNVLADPVRAVKGLGKHLLDPYWFPLWDACQALGMPVHIHESGGAGAGMGLPRWSGYTANQFHSVLTIPAGGIVNQIMPSILLSGMLDRFPRLKWVGAEMGLGWVCYVGEACDHEWERRHLWTEGLTTRPSELLRRQVFVDFWYDVASFRLRHVIGVDNIMWQSDFPHTSSTYPESRKWAERSVAGLPEDEQKKLLYQRAMRVYRL